MKDDKHAIPTIRLCGQPPRQWYRPADVFDPIWRDTLPRRVRIQAIDVHIGRLMEHVRR
jgi:hypothetical protein